MEKYDELLKALRCCATPDNNACKPCPRKERPYCKDDVLAEAVNAIVELQRIHEQDEELIARLADKHAKILEVLNG